MIPPSPPRRPPRPIPIPPPSLDVWDQHETKLISLDQRLGQVERRTEVLEDGQTRIMVELSRLFKRLGEEPTVENGRQPTGMMAVLYTIMDNQTAASDAMKKFEAWVEGALDAQRTTCQYTHVLLDRDKAATADRVDALEAWRAEDERDDREVMRSQVDALEAQLHRPHLSQGPAGRWEVEKWKVITGSVVAIVSALVALIMALFGHGCAPAAPHVRPVDPIVGAGCAEACQHAVDLGCPETITPTSGTCADACWAYERNGGDYCTAHLAGARDCAELERVAMEGCR